MSACLESKVSMAYPILDIYAHLTLPEPTTDDPYPRQACHIGDFQGARFFRWSEKSLHALWALSGECNVVLLTPAVPLVNSVEKGEPCVDPFEAFGRAMSQGNGMVGVEHVPFVPERGLVDLHLPFIQSADAIIVVTLKPVHLDKERASLSIEAQNNFVVRVSDAIRAIRANSVRSPLCCVQFGSTEFEPPREYDNVIRCASYTKTHLLRAVDLLMGRQSMGTY